MFDPNPVIRDLTLDDVDAFLGDNLEGKTLDHAREALRTLWKIPTKFPAPGDGGFSNNVDNVLRGLTRARLAGVGSDLAQNGKSFAAAWLYGTYAEGGKLRDEQHRYLRGVYDWSSTMFNESDRKDATWALGQHNAPEMGIQKLEDFVRKDFSNLRTFMRAAENSMIGACWLKDQGRGVEARDIASRVAKALDWFYSLRFQLPDGDYPGEAPGWGRDAEGIPFHVDRLGRGGDGWNRQKNGLHVAWQEFMMQPNALDTIASAMAYIDGAASRIAEIEDTRTDGNWSILSKWFWSRAYNDSDDPMHRGFGQTAAFGVFKSLDPLLVARPQELGIATGEMLWTPWLMARNDEDVRRMLEALVVQGEAHWGKQNYGMQLLAPEFLEHVAAKKKEQQPDPEPEPDRRSEARDELRELVKLGEREGLTKATKAVRQYAEMLREPDDKQAARMLRDARRAVRRD